MNPVRRLLLPEGHLVVRLSWAPVVHLGRSRVVVSARVLGLDLGSKRIGVALSDASATIATPFTVLHRAKRRADDHAAIARLVEEEEVQVVVVGLPLSLSGALGPAAQAAAAEAEALATVLGVPVDPNLL